MSARYLTERQAAEACGVTERTVRNWTAKTEPGRFKRSKRQGRYWWDATALVEWLGVRGWNDKADALQAWCMANAGEAVAKSARRPRRPRGKPAAVPTGDMDIFATRNLISGMLVEMVSAYQGASVQEITAASKSVRDTAEVLRKLEMDCLDVDRQLGKVMPVAAVERIVGRLLSEARTNLQSLRYALVDDLAAMSDPEAISRLLDDRFAASLRSIEDAYLSAEITRFLPNGAP